MPRCCVTTTLRECADRGFECCVLSDCTTGFDAQQVTTSLDIVAAQDGLFGFVGESADFLAATSRAFTQLTPPSTPPLLSDASLPSIDELIARYRKGATTLAEVVNLVFDRIEKYKAVDPAVWIHLESREACLEVAAKLTAKYADKPLPPLYGIPFSVKDTIDVAGVPTTAACPSYTYTPTQNALAVQYVLDAGGIYIGKTNLDQLATGLNGTRSPYGAPRSVFSSKHISGGSSSGSAVSVAAGLVSFGLATDTAGSGRVPAAYNGIIGFKPTKGTVSARGLVPACRTLDTITVVTPNVTDTRKVWRLIAVHDRDDPFSKLPQSLPVWQRDFRGYRVGGFTFAVPPAKDLEACTPAYKQLFEQAVQTLRSVGGRLVEIDYEPFAKAGDLLYDASLLHERMTCIGLDFLRDNLESLHPVTRQLFATALEKPPSAYDVFRDQALQIQLTRKAQQAFDVLRGGVDVLVVPTTTCHPTVAEMEADPLKLNSRLGIFTHYGNVVDLCGVNVPTATYADGEGTRLPFGITVLGGSGFDAKVLDIAAVAEDAFRQGLTKQ
jgi:allophanate hydrolase